MRPIQSYDPFLPQTAQISAESACFYPRRALQSATNIPKALKNRANRLMLFFLGVCLSCPTLLNAQSKEYYEFNCEYFDNVYICAIYRYGDTVLVFPELFEEITSSNDAIFTFQDGCVYLTINGQKGLFQGRSEVGSWKLECHRRRRSTFYNTMGQLTLC